MTQATPLKTPYYPKINTQTSNLRAKIKRIIARPPPVWKVDKKLCRPIKSLILRLYLSSLLLSLLPLLMSRLIRLSQKRTPSKHPKSWFPLPRPGRSLATMMTKKNLSKSVRVTQLECRPTQTWNMIGGPINRTTMNYLFQLQSKSAT